MTAANLEADNSAHKKGAMHRDENLSHVSAGIAGEEDRGGFVAKRVRELLIDSSVSSQCMGWINFAFSPSAVVWAPVSWA